MSPDDEPDDAVGFEPPLPPEDRLWRHPSELGALGPFGPGSVGGPARGTTAPVATGRGSGRHPRRRLVLVGTVSGVLGAAAMLSLVIAMGAFRHQRATTAIEQIQLQAPTSPAASDLAIADKVFPAVARVDSTTAAGVVTSSTAVVFRSDGHLLTTSDAVNGADTITVQLYDGSTYVAQRVSVDRISDLAVLRINRLGLQTAVLSREGDLQLGEPAMAIESVPGKPGAPTVSVGLISALGRRVESPGLSPLHDMIQTNVRISTDRSGAVLIDSSGAALGIITHRGLPTRNVVLPTTTTLDSTTTSGTFVPRYATPIEYAEQLANQMILTGKAIHPWLGADAVDLTEDQIEQLGRPGARLQSVSRPGPAAAAGLRNDDVIVAIDDTPVTASADLAVAVRQHRPSDSVTLTYLRDGNEQVTSATLAEKSSSS